MNSMTSKYGWMVSILCVSVCVIKIIKEHKYDRCEA